MPDNLSKLTPENVEIFIAGLQNGKTQKQISEETGISQFLLSNWKQRALRDKPLSGIDLLLQPLRDFLLRGQNKVYEHSEMRTALIAAVTTDRVTMTEKVTEIVKLMPSQRQALDGDLANAFDTGEVVLIQKVTTTQTENPDPTAVIKAYEVLFPENEESDGDTDD